MSLLALVIMAGVVLVAEVLLSYLFTERSGLRGLWTFLSRQGRSSPPPTGILGIAHRIPSLAFNGAVLAGIPVLTVMVVNTERIRAAEASLSANSIRELSTESALRNSEWVAQVLDLHQYMARTTMSAEEATERPFVLDQALKLTRFVDTFEMIAEQSPDVPELAIEYYEKRVHVTEHEVQWSRRYSNVGNLTDDPINTFQLVYFGRIPMKFSDTELTVSFSRNNIEIARLDTRTLEKYAVASSMDGAVNRVPVEDLASVGRPTAQTIYSLDVPLPEPLKPRRGDSIDIDVSYTWSGWDRDDQLNLLFLDSRKLPQSIEHAEMRATFEKELIYEGVAYLDERDGVFRSFTDRLQEGDIVFSHLPSSGEYVISAASPSIPIAFIFKQNFYEPQNQR